jgi:hypothetical protein
MNLITSFMQNPPDRPKSSTTVPYRHPGMSIFNSLVAIIFNSSPVARALIVVLVHPVRLVVHPFLLLHLLLLHCLWGNGAQLRITKHDDDSVFPWFLN